MATSLTQEQIAECAKVKALFKAAGLKQADVAKRYGLGSPSNLSQYLGGHRALSAAYALKLAHAIGCDVADFSPRLARETALMSEMHRDNAVPYPESSLRKIPILSYVQAGDPNGGEGSTYRQTAIDQGNYILADDNEVPEEAFALVIKGDSMEPDFHEGDRIIVDPTIRPKAGSYVVARRDDPCSDGYETTFKKYRVSGYDEWGREIFDLIPLNPDYPSYRSNVDRLTVIGVAISHNRPLI